MIYLGECSSEIPSSAGNAFSHSMESLTRCTSINCDATFHVLNVFFGSGCVYHGEVRPQSLKFIIRKDGGDSESSMTIQ
eukprot:14767075-Ditylum_brightwellii.AAC.1